MAPLLSPTGFWCNAPPKRISLAPRSSGDGDAARNGQSTRDLLNTLAAITCNEAGFDPSATRGPTRRPRTDAPRAIRRRFRHAAVQRAPLRSRGLSFPKVRHCTNGHGHVSPGCRPLRGVEVRRQKGDPARRHKGGAQNAARVQIRYGVIPTGAAEVICPAEGCRTE
jgi:hypothetical protein